MERLLVLSILMTLLSVGCSKSNETAPAGPVINPSKPVPPVGTNIGSTEDEEEQEQEEDQNDGTDINIGDLPTDEGDEVDVVVINPNDPCYKYMKDQVILPVANCTKMINGRMGGYPNVVKFAKLCLLKSSYNNGISIFTVEGDIIEHDDDWNQLMHRIYGFKKTSIENDQVQFNYKDDDYKTTVTYDLIDETLKIKQVTKTFKKKVRQFKLGCTPVEPIR